MNFSEPFILRPIGTTLLAIGLFLVGAVAYQLLPVASMAPIRRPWRRLWRPRSSDGWAKFPASPS
jgi:hypothetical protein